MYSGSNLGMRVPIVSGSNGRCMAIPNQPRENFPWGSACEPSVEVR